MKSRNLQQILETISLPYHHSGKNLNIEVTGIQYDSRSVKDGQIFVALEGENVDGHIFIESAIKNGASVIIGTQDVAKWRNLTIPYLQFKNSREAMAYISAGYYDFPSRSMVLIGVTGTDGKTTTCNFIYQILQTAGINAGMISTVNAQIGDEVLDTGFHVTTPESPSVQYYLWKMKEAGITHVVLETTSHGLAQHRVTGCEFDIAVVTNITHEHLDYHGSYEEYLHTKGILFASLTKTPLKPFFSNRIGVINKDDQSYEYLNGICQSSQIHYSLTPDADIWPENIKIESEGLSFTAKGKEFSAEVYSHLPGQFNISNVLAAMSVGIFGLNLKPDLAAKGIRNMLAVPGRMESIKLGQNFQAIVDFAHTPNALENAILTLRKITSKRVITIFGSAGLRDREKRHMMAEKSAQLADITIITAEDPRTESLDAILNEMQNAAINVGAELGKTLFIVPDRGNAIELGVRLAEPGDVVVACGKGHEQSMCFGQKEYPWDDRTAMRSALSKLLEISGPAMPYLPTRNVE